MVGQDPLQGVRPPFGRNHSSHGDRRPAGEVELLRFLPRRGDFEVVMTSGVVGGGVVDDPPDHVPLIASLRGASRKSPSYRYQACKRGSGVGSVVEPPSKLSTANEAKKMDEFQVPPAMSILTIEKIEFTSDLKNKTASVIFFK
jgi:hypothetical protein